MNLLRQVVLDRSNRRKDKSVSITFITDLEQDSEQFMEIDRLIGERGILYFKSSGSLTQEEVDELDNVDIEVTGKTKSQQLRNAIYVLWKKSKSLDTKEEFYSNWMNKFKQHILDKAPED